MENEYLDKVIKAFLEQYDAGNPGDSWASLQDKLDLVPDSSFDEIIKNKLNNIDPIYDAATWASLATALSQLDTGLNIDELLDSKAKDILQDIDTSYNASTWDLLENKIQLEEDLSSIEIPEEVDLAAYGSLENLSVPYDENNWEDFQDKLDKEFVLPYTLLFKYKFAEVAILLLFLLGVTQFIPLKKSNKIFSTTDKHVVTNIDQTFNNEADTKRLNESNLFTELNTKNNQPKVEKIAKQLATKSIAENVVKVSDYSEIVLKNNSAPNITLENASGLAFENKKTTSSIPITTTSKNESVNFSEAISLENIENNSIVNKDEKIIDKETQLTLNLLEASSIEMLSDYTNEIIPDCIICKNPISLLRWRLSAMVNADYNYIMTPYDNALSVKSYQHAALGYGAGLATSLGLGRWDIELGANYASRKYTPKPISEKVGNILDGYLNFELDKIELNILNIPLHIRYYFKTEKKTELFISGGASMNIAMQANYFKKAEFASRGRTPDLGKANQLLEETLINTQKIYSLGLLDGGSFLENRYFTADLGLGIERKISHRYSIFGQANYQHFLDNGIGPNKDRFNSVSLSAGARALFR